MNMHDSDTDLSVFNIRPAGLRQKDGMPGKMLHPIPLFSLTFKEISCPLSFLTIVICLYTKKIKNG
jgi:hypothetical protein